ncbi:ABC transporter ATP-binding protein [Eubacterium barkeri]|uniref:ABC-2 type transport system ATP-binding protein n=1 Tax=Eubacterium barkeri TaxID=1528 RepID=A0A1H3I1K6_EUBBA|nr:ABC transporter ATP-binding protein [Eubacterium barkeri]SDY21573.1 ABC-2 type transport system ATP-binding protein [Eubacterium barkeri]
MSVLTVEGLCKTYPAFTLKDVSFHLTAGKITGFIGRNGAGKSTTLNALLHYVHPDAGQIRFFDMDLTQQELAIKERIGFVGSGVSYYPRKKLDRITAITRAFYRKWDDGAYAHYMELFELDGSKTPSQLSAGMKVKYALALALSHNAELLLLDEPTSGLDPVSRDELLDVFLELCDRGKSILFSTHIISDLDKCADDIIYIKKGRIIAEQPMKDFLTSYQVATLPEGGVPETLQKKLVGYKRSKQGDTALIPAAEAPGSGLPCRAADLEDIMIHIERVAE